MRFVPTPPTARLREAIRVMADRNPLRKIGDAPSRN